MNEIYSLERMEREKEREESEETEFKENLKKVLFNKKYQ
jgi:hypothetical protein